ncbi:unnamed protein product [Musa acuminata subsp. malaccensis]|uniref:(wild Malaysian banana) hypothetical protein n=1 Tax=Musa acuminata subsp. malaccensis TaxID=214687 RepID=A0A804J933_MUSAM|nr:unnamed protein product [Musa acuminata subsp. malaccensis]
MVVDHHSAEEFPTMQGSLQKKRKSRDVICQSSEQSNEDTEERKGCRQKKSTEETSTPDRKRQRTQIAGKILLLDEIINYVLSLQRQVEVLSMKLASMDLKFRDLFTESIGYVNQQQETGSIPRLSVPVQSVLRSSAIQQVPFDEATGNSMSHLLLHGGGATALPQDNGACLPMQVADQRHELFNEVVLNNISFFPVN